MDHAIGGHNVHLSNRFLIDTHHVVFLGETETMMEDPLEKEMATHSSVLAWRIPGTGEPGRRLSMGLHRVGHD